MPLSAGDKLGPYEIVAPLGAGGMGEVWKARDTRLDRIVAVKRLKARDRARFENDFIFGIMRGLNVRETAEPLAASP